MKLGNIFWSILLITSTSFAEVPVEVHPDQSSLLHSDNAQLADNKRLVYEFWVKIFQGKQLDLADQYLAEHYIQHNPNVPTGRQGFIDFVSNFKHMVGPTDHIENLVMITAENDIVVLSFRAEKDHPHKKGEKYTTTWFDMFRIEDGKIVEHWDPANIWG